MKKSKQIRIFFLHALIIFSLNAFSQESSDFKKKTNEIQFGFSTIGIKEQLITNAIQKGVGFYFGYSRTKETLSTYQRFEFNLNSTSPKSSYESEPNSFLYKVKISYRSLFKINRSDTRFNLYLGGLASFETQVEYFDNWDENHFYWLTAYSLGLDLRCEYQTSSDAILSLEGSIPILALNSRPPSEFPYTQENSEFGKIISRLHHNMQLSMPSKHLVLNLELAYKFKPDAKFRPTLFWRFNYLNNHSPLSKKITQVMQVFGMKFHI